jgi:large subunit ribosomal protein L46
MLATEATTSPRPPLTTAVILNRSPLITRTPTPFECAFYKYQARIQRTLHNPFPYDFYFKQGSPLEVRFNKEERKRERRAFGRPFGVDDKEGTTDEQQLSPQEGEDEVIMPRTHEADVKNDTKSLDRRGQRNLYLLLKSKEGGKEIWRFPQGVVQRKDLLHQVGVKSTLYSWY